MGKRWAILAVLLGAALAACYLPDKFRAELRLGRTGDYGFAYYGELVWAPLFRDIQQNRIEAGEIPAKIARVQKDLQRDSDFKSIQSLGAGRFKVTYERQGHLRSTDMFAFVRRNAVILEAVASADGRITINGNTLKPSDAQSATNVGLQVQGEFRIVTDGMVIEHNAGSVKTMGPYRIYIWTIQNAFSPAPHMVFMREGAWNAKEQTAK